MALAQHCADVSVGHRDPQLPWQKIQTIYVSEYVKAQVPPPCSYSSLGKYPQNKASSVSGNVDFLTA